MSITSTLYLGFIFVTVFGLTMLAIHSLMPGRGRKRLHAAGRLAGERTEGGKANEASAWGAKIVQLSGPLAQLSVPAGGWEKSALRTRFMHAGLRGAKAPTVYFAAKTLLALALPALVLFAGLALGIGARAGVAPLAAILLLCAAFGFYLPNAVLAALVKRRQRIIFENFPDALDLMTVCIEAGLSIDAAIDRVAQEGAATSPVISDELHLVTLELRAGNSKERALRNLAIRTGVADIDALAGLLIQAEQFGTSIGGSLRVHSDHLRTKRRRIAEESAAKVALKLLMPLIFCIFPALMLIMLGPAMLQIYRVLLPSLGGQ